MAILFPILPIVPLLIYLLAALLPAAILLQFVYRHDRIESEPPGLLIKLVFGGCLSALCAGLLEVFGESALAVWATPGSPAYAVLLAFLVVAVAEEGAKFFFLKRISWRHPAFNYRFDGVVYAVFVSLGFAALENVQYVMNYGLSVALPRAFLSIPGHMSFAIFMGIYYGRARLCENQGYYTESQRNLWIGYLFAVFLHGFYDACAMLETMLSTIVFVGFVAIMFLLAFKTLRREAMTDEPIY